MYCDALFIFKDTLSTSTLRHTGSFTLEISSIFADRFGEFKNWTKLHVYGGSDHLPNLHLLLKYCNHWKQLFLCTWVGDQVEKKQPSKVRY